MILRCNNPKRLICKTKVVRLFYIFFLPFGFAEGESFLFLIDVMETRNFCHLNGYIFLENKEYIFILKEKTIEKFAKKHEGQFYYDKSLYLSVKLTENSYRTSVIPIIAVFDKKRKDFFVVVNRVVSLKAIFSEVVPAAKDIHTFVGTGPTKESWDDLMKETYPAIIANLYYPDWKPKPNYDMGMDGKTIGCLRNMIPIVENYDFFISNKE